MTNRPLLFLLAVTAGLALAPNASAVTATPFGAAPPVVRPGPARTPTAADRWLPWRVFTWRDGVKPGAPALALDSRGYLWAGTPDGPIRYNGQTWRKVDVPGEPNLQVWSIAAGRDGSVWFGLEGGGMLHLRNGVWTRFDLGSGLTGGLVESLLETGQGGSEVWVGTATGLARCRQRSCVEEKALHGSTVRALVPTATEDGRPALWIGTNRGLLRLDGVGGPSPVLSPVFADPAALPSPSIRSLAETVSPDGTRSLWVGTEAGLARLREGVWTRYDAASGFPRHPVLKLLPSRSADGRTVVWAASFGSGLVEIGEDGRWTLYDTRSGLPANYVYNLLVTGQETGEPILWVATPAGLARLDRERWHGLDTRSGLPNDIAVGVGEAEFPDGPRTWWVGTIGGMVRLTPAGWKPFTPVPGQPTVVFDVLNVQEAGGKVFWMAALDGLHRFSRGRWTHLTSRNSPLPHDWIMSLLATPSGDGAALWAGTTQGLVRIEGESWTLFRTGSSGLPGNEVRALARSPLADGGEVVWAATDKGVGRFAGGVWEKAAVPCLPHPRVYALRPRTAPDGSGWLWIGTEGGLARARLVGGRVGGGCEALTVPALSHPSVARIETDAFGRVYLFTDWGVNRLTLSPSDRLGDARIEELDAGDGLPGMEFNRASFRDHLGRIWAGAVGGAAVLDPVPPRRQDASRRGPPLLLERLLVSGRERPLASGAVLRHEDSLEIHYTLLSYRREHATRYRTQLVGLEDEPSAWNREAQKSYNRLPRGRYTFRVWARDGDGTPSGPAEVSFQVRPTPWLSWWALALYALALIGVGYGANHLRVETLARRALTLEAQVAERTSELAEANRKLEQASLTDPLTALGNRRFLSLSIDPDLRQALRNALGTTTVPSKERNGDLIFYFLDIDRFKRLNDRRGHAAGDMVLVELARRLREVARTTDVVVRWGGEEFLIVSRWTDRTAGDVLASRILEAVGGEPFPLGHDLHVAVTCSVGWAPYPWRPEIPEAVHFEQVLSLADRALYLAKREGRNRAVGVLPLPGGDLCPTGPLEEHEGKSLELVRTLGLGNIPETSELEIASVGM
ncbi:MAG TPA: diguanylate cyclase [Thermoanaerobaculia bacterium]|nr:diguanylate cyclase [Thermoanaerobaculia bacterium]